MLLILQLVYRGYVEFTKKYADRRVDHFPLMGSPLKIIILTAVYITFAKKWGPYWMRNRQPYNLKNVMIVYNALQVVVNFALFVGVTNVFLTHAPYRDWRCMKFDRTERTDRVQDVYFCYVYYVVKVVDYMDTVFMVLRKNYRQVTFLHCYHHAMMGLTTYAKCRYMGGGHLAMVGYLNALVHAIMYSYYLLCTLRPDLKQSQWKKVITQIQMVQFALILVHCIMPFFHSNCDVPKLLLAFALTQNFLMISLFTNFYYKTYIKKPRKLKACPFKNATK